MVGYASLIKILENADIIIAHNAIGFDVPVLKQFFPDFKPKGTVFDTLVMCKAVWHDVKLKDFGRVAKGTLPKHLLGSHSLEAYGYRMGEYKGNYGKQDAAWDVYTEDMAEYCKQDVVVLGKLYNRLIGTNLSPEMIELENRFAEIMFEQDQRGVCFDEAAAISLMFTLRTSRNDVLSKLHGVFGPQYEPVDHGKTFISKVNNKKRHITKGSEFCKIKLVTFNPGSRQQIANRLIQMHGWEPKQITEKGAVQINEGILKELPYPEARLLEEYLMVNKRLSQLADGNQAWLKKVKNGRIFARVNTGGAISGRCTHSSPNLAQVPSVNSSFGNECRSLFTAGRGYAMVGCDASGLELRCLAHYLGAFDNGAYADIVLNGDIHTANMEAAGLPERNMAKTFIYGWLYGAGVEKIGKIVGGGSKEGAKLQTRFMEKFPAIKKLKHNVGRAVEDRGYVTGLDGRRMRVRSPHAALNLLLQGAGALIMKKFAVILYDMTTHLDRHFVLNVHDEIQAEVKPVHVKPYEDACHEAFKLAGEYFNFRIIIEGDVKVGKNWQETH
jgi:DNA polymerase-1